MKRWKKISLDELKAVWEQISKDKACYNGVTHHYLIEKYGQENLKHKRGYGWYKLTQGVRNELCKAQRWMVSYKTP